MARPRWRIYRHRSVLMLLLMAVTGRCKPRLRRRLEHMTRYARELVAVCRQGCVREALCLWGMGKDVRR